MIEAAVYGLFNFALWAWYLVGVTLEGAKAKPVLYSFMFFVICVFTPAVLAFAASKIRRLKWVCGYFGVDDAVCVGRLLQPPAGVLGDPPPGHSR